MKVFENKNIIKKVSIAILIVVIFTFLFSGNVKASSGIGGKLLEPVVDLVLALGDGVYDIVHKIILQQDVTLLHIDFTTGFWEGVWKTVSSIAVFIGAAVIAAVAIIATAGIAAGVVAALTGVTLGTIGVGTVLVTAVAGGTLAVSVYNSTFYPEDEMVLPLYSISPEEIFSNELVIFDVDFFNPDKTQTLKDEEGNVLKDSDGNTIEMESTAKKLRNIISNWYIVLRDISLVALLSVLVYIGIKILISSTSGDKAKYKQMLKDWIVAICLLFVMQYIMSFSNILVSKVIDFVSGINTKNYTMQMLEDKDGKITENLKENYNYTDDQIEDLYVKDEAGEYIKNGDNKYIYWNTDLVGYARLNAQMGKNKSATYAGYTVIFLVLVFYTVFFVFTYLKRVIYMAFLTIIAPLVALTYPIDKINDGKAQAFDMWFKEYIFNLLIQPMHLILYTILIVSAFELATSNIIYSLVALGFMVPAEKLLRKFFGFEKAQTPGLLGGPAGAALTMTAMNKLFSKGGKRKTNKASGNSSGPGEESDKSNIKFKDLDSDSDSEALIGGNNSNNALGANGLGIDNRNSVNLNSNGTDNNVSGNANGGYFEDKISEKANNLIEGIQSKGYNFGNLIANTPQGQTLAYRTSQMKLGMKKLKNKSRILNAGGEVAKYYARGMRNKLKGKLNAKNVIRTAGNVAAGGVLGATGLALGVISGDPSNAVKYTAAGAIGGYHGFDAATNFVSDNLGVPGTLEVANRALLGDDKYEQKQRDKYIKEKQNDFDFQNKMLKEMSGDKNNTEKAIKEVFPVCAEYGFTEAKEVAAISKMVEKEGYNINEAMGYAQKAKKYGKDTTDLSAKDDKEYNETLINNFIKKGYSENDAKVGAKGIRNGVDKYNKYFYKNKGK